MMDLLEQAAEFEKAKMSHMSTSDRVHASREAKRLVLAINEMYKERRGGGGGDAMKRITAKKKKIEVRLKGRSEIS